MFDKNSFDKQFRISSAIDLKYIIDTPDNYSKETVEAARKELEKRNLKESDIDILFNNEKESNKDLESQKFSEFFNLKKYKCQKCFSKDYEIGKIRTTGSFASKIFEIQDKRFVALSCKKCGYTEFYKTNQSLTENIIDIFF